MSVDGLLWAHMNARRDWYAMCTTTLGGSSLDVDGKGWMGLARRVKSLEPAKPPPVSK